MYFFATYHCLHLQRHHTHHTDDGCWLRQSASALDHTSAYVCMYICRATAKATTCGALSSQAVQRLLNVAGTNEWHCRVEKINTDIYC